MAKAVKFLSPYQYAYILKLWTPNDPISLLEEMIEQADPAALYIDSQLAKFGYGSWEDPEYGEGFSTPPTRILVEVLKGIMKGGKQFIQIDEELIRWIPNPPKKWRWRQVDKCHRRWGWVA